MMRKIADGPDHDCSHRHLRIGMTRVYNPAVNLRHHDVKRIWQKCFPLLTTRLQHGCVERFQASPCSSLPIDSCSGESNWKRGTSRFCGAGLFLNTRPARS